MLPSIILQVPPAIAIPDDGPPCDLPILLKLPDPIKLTLPCILLKAPPTIAAEEQLLLLPVIELSVPPPIRFLLDEPDIILPVPPSILEKGVLLLLDPVVGIMLSAKEPVTNTWCFTALPNVTWLDPDTNVGLPVILANVT